MRLFITAPDRYRDTALELRSVLVGIGHTDCSFWLTDGIARASPLKTAPRPEPGDIKHAPVTGDAMVVIPGDTGDQRERVLYDIGCADALNIPVFILGSRTAYTGCQAREFETVPALAKALGDHELTLLNNDADGFQMWTRRTAKYPDAGKPTLRAVAYTLMGSAGEVGELIDKVMAFAGSRLLEGMTPEGAKIIDLFAKISAAAKGAEDMKREIRSGAMPVPDLGQLPSDLLDAVELEGGDVAWYLARIFDDLGVPLSRVLSRNMEKLKSRLERGVLHGRGDNR